MIENASLSDFQSDGGEDGRGLPPRPHELNGETHDYTLETFAGVLVNQTVPHSADIRWHSVGAVSLSKPSRTTDVLPAIAHQKSRHDSQEFTRNGVESAVRRPPTEDGSERYMIVAGQQRCLNVHRERLLPVHEFELPHAACGGPTRQLSRRLRVRRPPAGRG